MSYDLYFWRQQQNTEVDPGQVLLRLSDSVEFPGIVGIPLETVRWAFQQEFPGITGEAGSLDWEGEGSYFQVGFTFLDERMASMITVSCGYELLESKQVMRQFERVAASLGCRMYDPQRA